MAKYELRKRPLFASKIAPVAAGVMHRGITEADADSLDQREIAVARLRRAVQSKAEKATRGSGPIAIDRQSSVTGDAREPCFLRQRPEVVSRRSAAFYDQS
jgi:hypothetical protein